MPETIPEIKSKSPYTQIALTYFRRKMFWISGAVFIFILIGLAFRPFYQESQQENQQLIIRGVTDPALRESIRAAWAANNAKEQKIDDISNIRMIFFGLAWILATILIHLKQQIASPRAVLIPRYRLPHILVAAVFALIPLLLISLCISAAFALPPLAVLALAVSFSALVLWTVYLPKWPLVTILVVLYLGCFTSPGSLAFHAALTNTAILPSPLLITLALAAIVALAHRLMHLREEMPEYSRQIATNQWQTLTMPHSPQSPAPQINYDNPLNRLFYAPAYNQLARLAVSPPASLWVRFQRWRLAGNSISFTLIFVPIILLQIFGMARLTGSVDVHLWSFDLICFPALVIPQLALTTWRTLGIESLRPLTRAAYLRERAAFVALQFVQTWFITAATMLACAALVQPQILRNPTLWFVFAASALAQFPIFAIFIWFLRLRSPFATLVSFGLSIPLCIAAIGIYIDAHLSLPAPWLAAIFPAILVLSALLLRDAYRRWLRTDLA